MPRTAGHAIPIFVFTTLALTLTFAANPSRARADAGVDAATAPGDASAGAACDTVNLIAGKEPSDSKDTGGDPVWITDSAIAPEGAQWDAPAGVTFDTTGSFLTYDLGEPRSIGALYLQADANDIYRVSGSLSRAPNTFEPIVDVDNVVDRLGHGLRGRALKVGPVTVRYLRVAPLQGDGFFSVAEFAAYCRAPTPFPPALRIADVAVARDEETAPEVLRDPSIRRIERMLPGAGIALMAWAYALVRKARKSHNDTQKGHNDTKPSVARPTSVEPSAHDFLRIMFVASGAAALIYEVVWFHLLRLVIGASALSVGIVLASFMGGMFLGALFFARFVPRTGSTLRVYAMLELGIGAFGLLMPLLLPAVRFIYVGLVGYGALGIALRGVIAAVLLLPPTALMGATLPAVARRYTSGRRGMSSLASLYAANIIGAVLGCLLSAFYLLAIWDVWVATLFAAALNVGIGVVALRVARDDRQPIELPVATTLGSPRRGTPVPPSTSISSGAVFRTRWVYLAAGLSGLTALGAQVVWTRILTLLFGATVYAFAIILAVFLAGLGIGSSLSAYVLRRGVTPMRGLAFSQMTLVPTLWLAAKLLAHVLPYASPSVATPIDALHALHVLHAIDVILPSAVLWGMSFPFALAVAGAGQADMGRSSGYVYAANTIGAIVGALAISFLVIPTWGTRVAEQSLVAGAAISAAAVFYAIRRAPEPSLAQRWPLSPAWALVVGAVAVAVLPGLSTVFKTHGRYIWWIDPKDRFPYVSEGAASTVGVHIAPNGYRHFHVSGRVEATNNPNDLRTERLIGQLSALTHPHPESVLVVGLGAGITAGAISLHPEVKRIVICEIEPRVVGAANLFAVENYSVLKDPRVEMVFDDARHFLATTRERFDIITSDPIHPWVRGNSVLFSREYYAIVKDKLKPGGVATQWVPLYETSELAIRIQMRTFIDAFPNGTVWNTASSGKGYDVVLVGAIEPLRLDVAAVQDRMKRTAVIADSLRQVRIASVYDLLATYGTSGPDMKGWLADAPINRDFSLKLEYISGMALNNKEADPIYAHMSAGRPFPEGMFVAPPEVLAELRRRLANGPPSSSTR